MHNGPDTYFIPGYFVPRREPRTAAPTPGKRDSVVPRREPGTAASVKSSQLEESRFVLNGWLDGYPTKLLLDSGASVNVVSKEVVKAMDAENRIRGTNVVISSAGGRKLNVMGVMNVEVRLGNSKECSKGVVEMYVIEGLIQSCILGVDGMKALEISLLFGATSHVLSGGHSIAVNEVSINSGLDVSSSSKLRNLIGEFSDLFEPVVPGSAKGCEHRITLEVDEPVVKGQYRLPLMKQAVIQENVEKMLSEGVIQESSSPFCAPVVLVTKKDGTERFCVDYRGLNNVTKKDKFPLPRIDDLLDKVKGAKVFSSLDLASGYWQVKMRDEDMEKTAFATPSGQYEFRVMPFGLTNAPATFQRLMNQVVKKIRSVLVYIDDLLIFSKDWDEHLNTLKEVFAALRQSGLKLKASKCHLGCSEVKFLGFILNEQGCSADPEKTMAIKTFPVPKNATELRRFLGLANYYRKFCHDFATIAAPLYELTSKRAIWRWGELEENAFCKLKDLLIKPPVLVPPDLSKPYLLYTDASGTGMGAVLSQRHNVGEKVIAFASQHFKKSERNYSTIEKEAAAVLWAVKHFRSYLIGAKFRILSDHAPLKWLFGNQGAAGRLGRWQAQLLEFEGLEGIEYIRGADNSPADALSRLEILELSNEDFKIKQEEDLNFSKVRDYLNCKQVWHFKDRLFIPCQFREKLMEEFHGKGVHLGIRKTIDMMKMYLFWPKMENDIKKFIEKCESCRRAKWTCTTTYKPLPTCDRPFKRVYMDYAGPLQRTRNGNRYFLVIVDDFTRYLTIYPTREASAHTTMKCFQNFVMNEGCPEELMTDNGTHFVASSLGEWFKKSNIKHIRTSPYHPSANGMAERGVRTVKTLIKANLLDKCNHHQWDEELPRIQAAYNASVHSSTGYSERNSLFEE